MCNNKKSDELTSIFVAHSLFKPTQEQISQRAYEIWVSEGRPEGQDRLHWDQAEQELFFEALEQS